MVLCLVYSLQAIETKNIGGDPTQIMTRDPFWLSTALQRPLFSYRIGLRQSNMKRNPVYSNWSFSLTFFNNCQQDFPVDVTDNCHRKGGVGHQSLHELHRETKLGILNLTLTDVIEDMLI